MPFQRIFGWVLAVALLPALLVCPASPARAQASSGLSRGYLTTPQELAVIRQRARDGVEPYAATVRALLAHDDLANPAGWVGGPLAAQPRCYDGTQRDPSGRRAPRGPNYLVEDGRLAYAKLLAAHLTADTAQAGAYAEAVRARLLGLLNTSQWGDGSYSTDNQCILYLSWYVPPFVMAADLLEAFPAVWSADDKAQLQGWLAREVYPKVAWASRARVNNWGSGGSYAAAMLADYLHDSGLTLEEREPAPRSLTPGQAYAEHTAEQLKRMSTVVAPRDERSSGCLPLKGIQPSGGIPDELRRATIADPLTMCGADYLPSVEGPYEKSFIYQQTHIEALIAHAELTWRRGNARLYDNIAADGSGSILRAIKFVIANPVEPSKSYDWASFRKAQLYVASRYYRDPAIARQLNRDTSRLRAGEIVTYAQVTHSLAPGEQPAPPPTVAPAGELPAPAGEPSTGFVTAGGTWALHNGVYTLSAPQLGAAGEPLGNTAIYADRVSSDMALTTLARPAETGSPFDDVAVIFSYQDARNYAYVSLNERNDGRTSGVFVMVDGVASELADITLPIRSNIWYFVQILKVGSRVEVMVDGQLVATTWSFAFADGRVGFGTLNNPADFTNVTVTPLYAPINERFQAAVAPFETLGGTWSQLRGTLLLTNPAAGQPGGELGNLAIHPTEAVGDFDLGGWVQARESEVDFNDVALIFSYQDPHNYAYVSLNERNDGRTSGLFALVDGVPVEVADITTPIRADIWYQLRLRKAGSRVEVTLDGAPVAAASSSAFGDGRVGFGTLNDAAAFDELQLTPETRRLLPPE